MTYQASQRHFHNQGSTYPYLAKQTCGRSTTLAMSAYPCPLVYPLKYRTVHRAAGYACARASRLVVQAKGDLTVAVGNTYRRLSKEEAPLSRSGIPKVVLWSAYTLQLSSLSLVFFPPPFPFSIELHVKPLLPSVSNGIIVSLCSLPSSCL